MMATIPETKKAQTKIQWLAAAEVFLMMVVMGSSYGWQSPFLAKLSQPDPPFLANKEQISWIASMNSLSRIISIISGSIAANFFGTKISLYVCGIYNICAWVTLICASSANIVIFHQFCCGLGMGTLWSIYPLYMGEIVNADIRGTIISFVTNGFMIGLLLGNLIGTYFDPWVFGAVNLFITVVYLVTFYFFPSTPQHLINWKKFKEAERAHTFYNDGVEKKEEFSKLKEFIISSPRVSFLSSLLKLRDPVNLKTFIMINIVYSLVQFSGTYAIVEYIEIIIMASKIEVILPSTLVTIMMVATLPASYVAVIIGDKLGRVTMLLFSCVVFCVVFILWGVSFHLLELGFSPSDMQWFVIIAALVYRINMTMGLTPIVTVLMSEIFAPNVKSISACLCNVTSVLCIFISLKNFQIMVDHMTYKYLFYFYAVLMLAIGIYTKLCVPETKGKTLQEIQNMLNNNSAKTKTAQSVPSEVYVNSVCEQSSNGDVDSTKM